MPEAPEVRCELCGEMRRIDSWCPCLPPEQVARVENAMLEEMLNGR